MFDFIPQEFYTQFYYYILLFFTCLIFIFSQTKNLRSSNTRSFIKPIEIFFLLFTIFYIGFRPISGIFGDMLTYERIFRDYQKGNGSVFREDIVFDFFIWICSRVMSISYFFFICSVLYVLPLWLACRKWFKSYSFYAFFGLLISFSFWSYGTNGIRNGLATSFFLFAISRESFKSKIIFILLAVGLHKSIIIPAFAYSLTYIIKNPKWYLYAWLACIPLSLIAGGFWESLFSGLVKDNRVSYLTQGNINNDTFSSTGFRWDFLLYSGSAIFVAYYFIIRNNFINKQYNKLVCTYIAANAFWILVIRANFSNRFAYLSWFMMGIIIFYPFLIKVQIRSQHKVLGFVLVAYFGFTFFMNVVLGK